MAKLKRTAAGKVRARTSKGNALYFNGAVGAVCYIPPNPAYNLTTAFTVEMVINPNQTLMMGSALILWFVSRQGSTYQYYMRLEPTGSAANRLSKLALRHYTAMNGNTDYYSNAIIPSDQDTHIAITFDSSLASGNIKFYINGQIDNLENQTLPAQSLAAPVTMGFGFNDSNGAQRYRGSLDTARVFNYARTAGQIYDSYRLRLLPLPQPGLIGDFGFDEASGLSATDRSSLANHGTLGGVGAANMDSLARRGATFVYSDSTLTKLLTI